MSLCCSIPPAVLLWRSSASQDSVDPVVVEGREAAAEKGGRVDLREASTVAMDLQAQKEPLEILVPLVKAETLAVEMDRFVFGAARGAVAQGQEEL